MRCAHVALVVLSTVFSMAWYKIVMQYSLKYPTGKLLYFLGIQTPLKACVYTEKIQVTQGIFHGIPFESVV